VKGVLWPEGSQSDTAKGCEAGNDDERALRQAVTVALRHDKDTVAEEVATNINSGDQPFIFV
jgi:hypothetical protein